jgi:hypothetical protein
MVFPDDEELKTGHLNYTLDEQFFHKDTNNWVFLLAGKEFWIAVKAEWPAKTNN